MTSMSGWRPLDFANTRAPKLLLKANTTPTGYHVQLIDLCRVWGENLSKRDIIRRAWDDGCSIDPSEDDKQFSIFLEKVESALNGGDGTTMDLLPNKEDGLHLKLSAVLPKPFKMFYWTIALTRQTDDVLADVLTFPLLRQASNLQSQVQQLIHELQEKDRVISKITDRLETSGNDLTTVFPGVSNVRTNKKKTQREQLARHVRGLADFDEAEWRRRGTFREQSQLWERANGLLRELPEPEGVDDDGSIKRKWWQELTTRVELGEGTVTQAKMQSSSAKINGTESPPEESMHDDEFQRQGTPVHLKRHTFNHLNDGANGEVVMTANQQQDQEPTQVDDGESTTEDEDDLDVVPKSKPATSPVKQSASPAPSAGTPKKLGALGGRLSRPPASPAREPTPEAQPQPTKSRDKLGGLGGKAKASDTHAIPSGNDDATSKSPAPRKMGIIGGKRKPSNAEPASARSPDATPSPEPVKERSRAPTNEPTPPPRETSQERADRKRDQLRRELEQKASAPAKKKRKF